MYQGWSTDGSVCADEEIAHVEIAHIDCPVVCAEASGVSDQI